MATSYNLNVTQGSEFFVTFTLKDSSGDFINLNQYSIRGKAKRRYGDTGVLIDLAPYSGVPQSGEINVKILASDSASLPVGQAFYNVEIYSGTYAENVVDGKMLVFPEVTT